MKPAKTRPVIHKPDFDVEGILRFAGQETTAPRYDHDSSSECPDRPTLTLRIKAEVVAKLTTEAARKEKTIEQVIEKLVSKHLKK